MNGESNQNFDRAVLISDRALQWFATATQRQIATPQVVPTMAGQVAREAVLPTAGVVLILGLGVLAVIGLGRSR